MLNANARIDPGLIS